MPDTLSGLIRRLAAGPLPPAPGSFLATVVSADAQAGVCDVTDADGTEYYDVRLSAKQEPGDLLAVPAPGSAVIVSPIQDIPGLLYVCMCSQISQVVFHGGHNGGMVLARELAAELDKIRALLDALQQALTAWVPVPGDGGSALKALAIQFAGLPLPASGNLENGNILQ